MRPDGWFSEADGAAYRRQVSRLQGETIVEVGVWLGRSLSYIGDLAPTNDLSIIAVDTWEGSKPQNDPTRDCGPAAFAAFHGWLLKQPWKDRVEVWKMASKAAWSQVSDNGLGLVFIDGDHSYRSVKADIAHWWTKVRPGGVLMGHDFHVGTMDVVRAVTEQIMAEQALLLVEGAVWVIEKPTDG